MSSQQSLVAVGPGQTMARLVPAPSSSSSNSSRRSSAKSSVKSSNPRNNTKRLSAAEIMKGKKDAPSASPALKSNDTDPYPGIDAVVHKAFKMRPYKSSDAEQRLEALKHLLNTNSPHPDHIHRMERDYAAKVAEWHADNDFLPAAQRKPFPYVRAREFRHLPEFKNKSKDMPNWLKQANEDLARYEALPQAVKDKAEADIAAEIASIRDEFKLTKFRRYDMEWNAANIRGYADGRAYRAYRLFSEDQHELLRKFNAEPNHNNKKALLQHINDHGELIREDLVPKQDAPKPKPKAEPENKKGARALKRALMRGVAVGKPTDV
jgi:hypothetical protein